MGLEFLVFDYLGWDFFEAFRLLSILNELLVLICLS